MRRFFYLTVVLTFLAVCAQAATAQQTAPIADRQPTELSEDDQLKSLWLRYLQVNQHLPNPDSLENGDMVYVPNIGGNTIVRIDSFSISADYPHGLWGIAEIHLALHARPQAIADSVNNTAEPPAADSPNEDDESIRADYAMPQSGPPGWLAVLLFILLVGTLLAVMAREFLPDHMLPSILKSSEDAGQRPRVSDDHPTLSHQPFREGGHNPDTAESDLRRLAEEHTDFDNLDLGEQVVGILRTEEPVMLHRYDRFGNDLGADELEAGAELTVIRATVHDGHEDIEYVFAAVRCMNRVFVPDGDFSFIPAHELDEDIQL